MPYRITVNTPRILIDLYSIQFDIKDVRGAGTSANVFLQMFGKQGKTAKIPLDGGKTNFQRGSTDVFGVEEYDVGEMEKILIGHDNQVTIIRTLLLSYHPAYRFKGIWSGMVFRKSLHQKYGTRCSVAICC